MEFLRRVGILYARFVAVSVIILSGWMVLVNLPFTELGWEPWVHVWILASGALGTVGGIVYLLSIDGPTRFRARGYRLGGWLAMLAAVLLPTSFSFVLVPMVLLLIPMLFSPPLNHDEAEKPVTSG